MAKELCEFGDDTLRIKDYFRKLIVEDVGEIVSMLKTIDMDAKNNVIF